MQIKRLWVSKYKNLEKLKFKFNSDLITLLVGQNGLGKSNLLEALAIIFSSLDLADKEEEFTSEPHKNFFEFRIWYTCKGSEIRIIAEEGSLKFEVKPIASEKYEIIAFDQFKKSRQSYLPDYIVGYYSGENNRIGSFFSRHRSAREKNLKSRKAEIQPALGKMFISDRNCGELLFFTMWVFRNNVYYGKKINELISEFLEIENDTSLQISFTNPTFAHSHPEQNADNLLENIQANVEYPFWGLTGQIDSLLRILYNNHLSHSIPRSYEDEGYGRSKRTKGYVFFDHLNYASLVEDLKEKFTNPINLFDAIHAADQLGTINQINGNIIKNGLKENHNYRELSEGEQQLLTVLGLILITGKDDCLFLFDEPDTHLNPKWQREFVGLLHRFNMNLDNSHIVVATHSPLIVQASEEADIFLFKKDNNDKVEAIYNDFKIQNWRIDQVLVSEYFELPSARPPALDAFMLLRETILSKSEIDQVDQELLASYEDELGIFPTGETREQIEAMLLIKKVATKINRDDPNTEN